MAKENLDDISSREIVISRVVDAPRELVWKVWTEAEHVAKWWGRTASLAQLRQWT